MPSGVSMDIGKGYDDMISCTTCSLSQHLMQKVLLPYFVLAVSSCFHPHVCLVVDLWTSTNSVNTFIYPYALPLLIHPLYFLKSLPKCNLSSSLRSLHICLNVSTARVITKWTQISVPSGIIASTKNSTPRNIKNSGNLGGSQFIQL